MKRTIVLCLALAGCANLPAGTKGDKLEPTTFEERWGPVELLEPGLDLTINRDRASKVFFCERHHCNIV